MEPKTGEDILRDGIIDAESEVGQKSSEQAAIDLVGITGIVSMIFDFIRSCQSPDAASRQIKRGGAIAKSRIRQILKKNNYPKARRKQMAEKLAERGSDLTEDEIQLILADASDVPTGPKEPNPPWPLIIMIPMLLLLTSVANASSPWPEFTQASIVTPMWPVETDVPAAPSLPDITIKVAPFVCPPCIQTQAMDWSEFNVTWETGGAIQAYPEISWRDDTGRVRYLTGRHTPSQVLSSLSQTRTSQTGNDAAQAPTPYSKIAEGLEAAGLKPGQSFIDIGCGDGRALEIAVERFNASNVFGIEIDPAKADEARRLLSHLGGKVEVINGDATAITIPSTDMAYVYLYPDTLKKLKPQLEKFGTVVSYMHQIPGMRMRKVGDFYIWNRGNFQVQQLRPMARSSRDAVWNGVAYSGPVCNSANCRMCNSIRSQLRR